MDEHKLGKIAWENFSNFLQGPDESNRKAKESSLILSEDGQNQLSLEFISTIIQLFEDNKFHCSEWTDGELSQETVENDEYLLDLVKLREKLGAQDAADNQASLEAFDSFFGKLEEGAEAVLITQSEFSAMVREKELMLLQKSFPVQDLQNGTPVDTI